jgi:hypothetical protein
MWWTLPGTAKQTTSSRVSTAPTPLNAAQQPKSVSVTPNPPAKSFGLAMGDTLVWLSQAQLNSELANIEKMGVTWIRMDFSWADVQANGPGSYDWSGIDRVVATSRADHLKILATLAYTPSWAGISSCDTSQQCAPASDSQFATFVTAAVTRYAPEGVHTWEIWNEPNLEGFWQPAPSALNYTHLLESSYTAIKAVDSSSTVLSGGLGELDSSPASINQQAFLTSMYVDGAKSYFDVLGYHAYSFPALPSYVASWSGWSVMNDVPDSLRTIMAANNDSSKQIWITEFGAPTNGPGAIATSTNFNFNASPDHVDDTLQAEMVTQATADYKADSWLGNFFWYTYQDLGTSTDDNNNFFGLLDYNGNQKPAYSAYENAINGS